MERLEKTLYQIYAERCVANWKEGDSVRNPFKLSKDDQEAIQTRNLAFRGTTLGIFNKLINAKDGTYTGAPYVNGVKKTSITYSPLCAQAYAFEALSRLKKDNILDEPIILKINMQPYKGRTIRGEELKEYAILGPIETKDIQVNSLYDPKYLQNFESFLKDACSWGVYPFNQEVVKQNPNEYIKRMIENTKQRISNAKLNLGGNN